MTNVDDIFSGGREVGANKFGFNKVGDFIRGTYTGYKKVNTQNGEINLYEIKADVGQFHPSETGMDENGNKQIKILDPVMVEQGEYYNLFGGKSVIDDGFNKVKPGTIVGIRFKEAIPSKKAGNSPFKVFQFVEFGIDDKWLGDNSDLASNIDF